MSGALNAPRIRIPRSARAGEVIEIRTLIEHPMETGLRQDGSRAVPRDMLTRMVVRMNGEVLLAADLRNGTAANPFHVFFVRMERSSAFEFTWTDERGRSARAEARVSVA
ncbi:thiosulfate oxidation carrier complex protein SoxZ [Roseomonas alkaliterrae]|uniref:Sulfur-oxidizing protein SoxZ n=1 Tax=Neoroseomonas alkaliterrae TaxID=1452450 RepID=A0A840Y4D9_9PROT|nr:thiosulfate oxidation carrier complex protein SoxZ [Neoroseomonas alkaliterrae]MBB5690851.1 sulfur-oxidizing protein SoxZ [Neoroseomonas alkaliterrae]MBR0677864.1 thiosulfate oxidation carrier complex protein SoxZ [Neoroseomonas alkaliterrae]